jgi:hypothetical protein
MIQEFCRIKDEKGESVLRDLRRPETTLKDHDATVKTQGGLSQG